MAGKERSVGESLTTLLEIIPSVAAATSFMVLVLAFVHEWSFYSVIGRNYQSLVSITDYFNSAVGWLPWAVLGFVTALLWTLSDPMTHVPTVTKDEYYERHRVRWFIDKAPGQFLFWSLTIAGAVQLLIGDWYTRGPLEFFSCSYG